MSEADVDLDCSACKEPIALPQKNWLPCAECDRAYHLYCLRPPLSEKPRGRWLCPAHSRDNAVEVPIDEASDRYLQLHLFPYQALSKAPCTKRRSRRAPMRAIEPPQIHRLHHEIALGRMLKEKRDTPILQSLMRKNKNKLVGDYYEELKHSQAQLVAEALDMQTVGSLDLETSNATATLHKLASLSPLFVQFLAWQRLMQLPDEVGLLDRGAACEALEGTALKKRKRLPEDALVPEPDPVPKKQQKTSRTSSVAPRAPEPSPAPEKEASPPAAPSAKERAASPSPAEKEEPAPAPASSPPAEKQAPPPKSTRRNQRKSVAASRKAAEQRKKEQEEIHAAIEADEADEAEEAAEEPSASSKPSSPAPASPTKEEEEEDDDGDQSMQESEAPAPEPEEPALPPPAKPSPPRKSPPAKPSPASKPKTVARKSSLGLDDETESMTESASFATTRTPRQSLNDASSVDATPPRANAPESSPPAATQEQEESKKEQEVTPEAPTQIRITVTAEILTEPKLFVIPVEKLPARVGRNDPRGPPPKKSLAVNLQEVSNHPTVKRVSHFHMEIMKRGDAFFLLCLGRNGVQVDDGVVTKNQCIALNSGRIVGVGPFQIRFQLI